MHKTTETENQKKNGESVELQRDISHELPGWLQEFRENFVDESPSTEPWENQSKEVKTLSMSSHELPNGAACKSGTGFGQAQC